MPFPLDKCEEWPLVFVVAENVLTDVEDFLCDVCDFVVCVEPLWPFDDVLDDVLEVVADPLDEELPFPLLLCALALFPLLLLLLPLLLLPLPLPWPVAGITANAADDVPRLNSTSTSAATPAQTRAQDFTVIPIAPPIGFPPARNRVIDDRRSQGPPRGRSLKTIVGLYPGHIARNGQYG
ncbi:MAG TPA: hypothetical protein VFJ19_17535 [Nocardioidaceae bacterium]|nr:hypothetical protein [Nocardioidaceae bacterium]